MQSQPGSTASFLAFAFKCELWNRLLKSNNKKKKKEKTNQQRKAPTFRDRGQKQHLTHPHFSKAALTQFDLQPEGFAGDFPGVLGQPLSLRFHSGAHGGQSVAQAICMLWTNKGETQFHTCTA